VIGKVLLTWEDKGVESLSIMIRSTFQCILLAGRGFAVDTGGRDVNQSCRGGCAAAARRPHWAWGGPRVVLGVGPS